MMKKPLAVWLLAVLLTLFAAGGLYGGASMLLDPSGRSMGVDIVLPQLPVPDFLLPGLFLLAVMGLAPLLLAFALLFRPRWALPASFFRWGKAYWAWTGTIVLEIVLAAWLLVEVLLIGIFPITVVTAVLGALILFLALLPGVRKHYS